MDDLISRQAAIDTIVNTPTDVYSHDRIVSVLDGAAFRQNEIIDIINALPSAQTERKKGRWIRMYYNRPKQYTRICSECGEICWFCGIGDYNYCPWCGADMRGDEDERLNQQAGGD